MNFKKEDIIKNKSTIIFIFLIMVSLAVVVIAESDNVVNLANGFEDFFVELVKGNVVGQESINKFGQNDIVGTVEEDVQTQGGILTFLTSAELMSIISSDPVNDNSTGSNARSVLIEGLDENFTEISEVVNLSSSAVNTTQEYIRVFRFKVNEVGTYGVTNAGTITATAASGSVQIEIEEDTGQSETSHFTVPAGKKAILKRMSITMDTGKVVSIKVLIRENADNVIAPFSPIKKIKHFVGLDTPLLLTESDGLLLEEKTDVWFTAQTTTGTAAVSINYDMVLYEI